MPPSCQVTSVGPLCPAAGRIHRGHATRRAVIVRAKPPDTGQSDTQFLSDVGLIGRPDALGSLAACALLVARRFPPVPVRADALGVDILA
jgi:hypothetical protein